MDINTEVGRRRFIELLGLGAATLVVGTAKWEEICRFLESFDISKEEKEALEIINKTPPNQRLHNLVVGPSGSELRRHPFAPTDAHDETNLPIGFLKADETVPEAITFPGLNPDRPGDKNKVNWYALPTRKNPDGKVSRLAFTYYLLPK